MKIMPPDVISHENQLQHLSEPSLFMLDVFRTADHAGQIFIPHRPSLNCSECSLHCLEETPSCGTLQTPPTPKCSILKHFQTFTFRSLFRPMFFALSTLRVGATDPGC